MVENLPHHHDVTFSRTFVGGHLGFEGRGGKAGTLYTTYIQTQFSNFKLASTEYKKELSSFPFMNMFAPTDMLTWLDSFAN